MEADLLVPVIQHTRLFQPTRAVMPEGLTIAEIIDRSGVHQRFWQDGVVSVDRKDGKESTIIPREWWAHVRPRSDGVPIEVSLWMPPTKGGGNILTIVATIAIIVAATVVSGGALAFLTPLLAAGTIGAAVAGAGIAVLGSLALRALTPPPSTQALTEGSGLDNQERMASIDGNVVRPGGIIPHTRGLRKIYPPVVCKMLIELVGNSEYASIIFGLSGKHDLTDLRADGASFDQLVENGELEYEIRDIVNDNSLITLVERQSVTDPNVIVLSQHEVQIDDTNALKDQTTPANSAPHWHTMRVDGAPDEVWIHLRWPGGLFDADNPTLQMVTPVRVRIREVGDTAWIRLPEVHFAYRKQETFKKDIRIIWGTAPTAPTPKTDRAPYAAYAAVVQRIRQGGTVTEIGDFGAGDLENFSDHNDSSTVVKSSTTASGWVGFRDDTHPRRAIKSQIAGNSTTGFSSAANVTIEWYGKSTPGAPANDTDGTLLATTGSFADHTNLVELTSGNQTTLFYSQWLKITGSVAGTYAFRRWDLFDDGDWSWLAHSSFYTTIANSPAIWVMRDTTIGTTVIRNTALYEDRAEFYLDPNTIPKGDYEVEIIRGAVVDQAAFDELTYQVTGESSVSELFKWKFESGPAEYEVPRDLGNVQYEMHRARFVRIWNEHPLPDAPNNLTLIAMIVKDRQIQAVSCLAEKYVPDWDGSEWTGDVLTSNPATHIRDMLAGDLNQDALSDEDDLIDNASLVALRTRAIAEGYEINAIIEGQSVRTSYQLAAGCAYARVRESEQFSVIIEKDRSDEAPVQIFSSRNSAGYQYRVEYPRRPSGFRVVYYNADDNYNETEEIIMDPDGDGGAVFEEARYDALVTFAEVEARALFDMKQSRLRGVLHSFDSNGQSIKCINGDLIGLNHPVLTRQFGAGYIQRIHYSSPPTHIISLELDGTVPVSGTDGFFIMPYTDDDAFIDESIDDGFWGPLSLGACVRLKNGGGWLTAEIVADETELISRTITFVTPQLATNVDIGGLVTVGELGEEYLRLIVREMVPKVGPSYPATLIAFDEAQGLWS